MKKISDLTPYTNILPYDSEIFGVYQPMIGWRSERIRKRIEKGFHADIRHVHNAIFKRFQSDFKATLNEDGFLRAIERLAPASLGPAQKTASHSFVIAAVGERLPPEGEHGDEIWDELLTPDRLQRTLDEVVTRQVTAWYGGAANRVGLEERNRMLAGQLHLESAVSGYLLFLRENKQFDKLRDLFYRRDERLEVMRQLLRFNDPLDSIDPAHDIDRAGLSPLGIVHLFRQYFFEFDTFLGSPVSHVWLSPGSTVELVEVHTRRTLTERTFETSFESTTRTEREVVEQDEISDAVKQANRSETKFGMNATVNQGWIGGSASASTSINMGATQDQAREVAHKHMRQQTEKLSTEIRKNHKSTFKTITEVTDTSSKRYVLTNSTGELLNYELRRKMRQVGVQVQDIGTYLAWQTYVDDPGRQLGIARLVHIAKTPEVGNLPPPESIPNPEPTASELEIDIPFEQTSGDRGDLDESFANGVEVDQDFNEGDVETIRALFGPYTMVCDRPGYEMAKPPVFDYRGNDVRISVRDLKEDPKGKVTFNLHLDHVNFRGTSPIRVLARLEWQPQKALLDKVKAENDAKVSEFNQLSRFAYEKAFVEAARERINMASRVKPRNFDDLREEERIVVYRSLIQGMLTRGVSMPDDRTRHVVSELLNTIFDIDKMLYFVAPEWWRPRLHQSHQSLGGLPGGAPTGAPAGESKVAGAIFKDVMTSAQQDLLPSIAELTAKEDTQVAEAHVVSWGGVGEGRTDNYYITEESEPARMGSSLGWLLQLDGDNLRNAFLNAPWVKAVIPVRPGKERAALNWLQRVHVEGSDGLDDEYVAPPAELAEIPHAGPHVTIRDAIFHLADLVAQKHEDASEVGKFPPEEIDDDNKVAATPIDKVYEHGFYPLQGGFKARSQGDDFEVFDQWVEILPTDQVVPVPVAYDPKTGRQL